MKKFYVGLLVVSFCLVLLLVTTCTQADAASDLSGKWIFDEHRRNNDPYPAIYEFSGKSFTNKRRFQLDYGPNSNFSHKKAFKYLENTITSKANNPNSRTFL